MKQPKNLIRYLVLVTVLSLLAGCSGINLPTAPANQPSSGVTSLYSIADVVAAVEPSVVTINTEATTVDIFNKTQTEQVAGSGWIIDAGGTIVTNNHVIEGATKITVTFKDNRSFLAEVTGADPLTDLATVRVKNVGRLPAAKVGNSSKLRVGDWVVAIGNPLGLGISAKEGIVSRLGVSVEPSPGQTLHNLIETSAAINPGNSGGPLVNMSGEVIGITSLKIGTLGVEGLGYAININDVTPVVQQLAATGCVIRAWLGPTLSNVDPSTARLYNLTVKSGALVTTVPQGSPAQRAGLAQGDVIIGFENTEITNASDLTKAINSSQIGQRVKLTYWRGNTKYTADVTLVESPPCKY